MYFGYTSCPDVCPTALAIIGNTLKKLEPPLRNKYQPVFISLDPQRDNVDILHKYGQYFYPTMISASAKKTILDKLTEEFWAFYHINDQTDSAMQYSIDHTSRIYILDRHTQLKTVIEHQDISPTLEKILRTLPLEST